MVFYLVKYYALGEEVVVGVFSNFPEALKYACRLWERSREGVGFRVRFLGGLWRGVRINEWFIPTKEVLGREVSGVVITELREGTLLE